ncbi:agamous-like MADS-box protein AGL11 [Dioscorea cayenensis subsp. rotundata]|uniref:Agamous-like MADS-box protein AGL11 n=1 Tax=Dioscorea cayennensis subsp. rotundata TaxID=55577 RepID=A0AB40B451_DIOCR|nr:agamous-like MADS-box protein AGL11 [Dioscorea cayenensis subsp. rotundata]
MGTYSTGLLPFDLHDLNRHLVDNNVFGSVLCSIKSTIERYKKAIADNSNSGCIIEVNSQQYYQQEATKLRHQIQILLNANRHLAGEGLSSLTIKELKQLESRLERGIARIRSKKHELHFAEIEYMQKRELELQNDNTYLRSKNPDRAMKINKATKACDQGTSGLGCNGRQGSASGNANEQDKIKFSICY